MNPRSTDKLILSLTGLGSLFLLAAALKLLSVDVSWEIEKFIGRKFLA